MELNKSLSFNIGDFNCEFRTLNESDVTQNYIRGLKDQKKYIDNIPIHVSVLSQKKYINDILYSKDNTICGLFINNKLVGTAGIQSSNSFFQHIKVHNKYVCTIGIFLFNKSYRGMGFGNTLVWAATYLCHNSIKLDWFGARMKKINIASVKSFLSCGFTQIYEYEGNCVVLLNYSELIKPELIERKTLSDVD